MMYVRINCYQPYAD